MFYCLPNAFDGQVVASLAANGKIVVFFLPVHVHGKCQVLAGLEKMQLFLQQERIGAEIDVFLARDQALDDLVNLRVHQGLAAGDRNHRCAALVHRFEAIFGTQIRFQNVRRILDFTAPRASQVATE